MEYHHQAHLIQFLTILGYNLGYGKFAASMHLLFIRISRRILRCQLTTHLMRQPRKPKLGVGVSERLDLLQLIMASRDTTPNVGQTSLMSQTWVMPPKPKVGGRKRGPMSEAEKAKRRAAGTERRKGGEQAGGPRNKSKTLPA